MAGKEEQEIMLISAINEAVKKSESKTISLKSSNGIHFPDVLGAEKKERVSYYKYEPYIDVVLRRMNGGTYDLSLKDIAGSPSIGGGGIAGLETSAPGMIRQFLIKLREAYIKLGYKKGDEIPEGWAKVPTYRNVKLITGTTSMGGPITHMYVGPKLVLSTYASDELWLNGNIYSASNYAASHSFYIRSRKRRSGVLFDPDKKDNNGYYSIYDKNNRRIVVVEERPSLKGVEVNL